jgi:hypothetical protein
MATAPTAIPVWIRIVSGLIALLEIGVSLSICFSPESVLENVDLTAKGVDYLAYMWAARQFALGVIFGYATLKKSVPMLTLAYIFFLVMFLGDLLIGIWQKNTALIGTALVMCLVAAGLLYALNRKTKGA